jgi:hypothetical protein
MTDSLQFGDARSNVSKKQGESNGHAQCIHNVIPVDVFMTSPTSGKTLRFQRFRGAGYDYTRQLNWIVIGDGLSSSEVAGRLQVALVK